MATLDELRLVDMIVGDCKDHAGQWTIVASSVPADYGKPFERRGCQVHYRPAERGYVDVLVRWPVPVLPRASMPRWETGDLA